MAVIELGQLLDAQLVEFKVALVRAHGHTSRLLRQNISGVDFDPWLYPVQLDRAVKYTWPGQLEVVEMGQVVGDTIEYWQVKVATGPSFVACDIWLEDQGRVLAGLRLEPLDEILLKVDTWLI